MYDVVIAGSGPAGLSAAIYAQSGIKSAYPGEKPHERGAGVKYL